VAHGSEHLSVGNALGSELAHHAHAYRAGVHAHALRQQLAGHYDMGLVHCAGTLGYGPFGLIFAAR
jgi:hypothetical protein